MSEKLVWTIEDILASKDSKPISELTLAPSENRVIDEMVAENGLIERVIIWLPAGTYNLVWVSVLMNARRLVTAVGGDDAWHSIPVYTPVKVEDSLKLVAMNLDQVYSHTVSYRLDLFRDEHDLPLAEPFTIRSAY